MDFPAYRNDAATLNVTLVVSHLDPVVSRFNPTAEVQPLSTSRAIVHVPILYIHTDIFDGPTGTGYESGLINRDVRFQPAQENRSLRERPLPNRVDVKLTTLCIGIGGDMLLQGSLVLTCTSIGEDWDGGFAYGGSTRFGGARRYCPTPSDRRDDTETQPYGSVNHTGGPGQIWLREKNWALNVGSASTTSPVRTAEKKAETMGFSTLFVSQSLCVSPTP